MPALELTPTQRRELRAQAHHLEPVVLIGNDGLSDAVRKEVDSALRAHGLIKVRAFCDARSEREAMLHSLAAALDAAPIQHIGKLLVLWRPQPTHKPGPEAERKVAGREVKVLKFSKQGGQRPEVKILRVLGNQRLTQGGKVKRAKPRQSSIKKRSQS